MIKNAKDAGADNLTPSVPQYFSWINNTNEGSTEEHTLINLEFFKYLKDTYGMQIKIYAWDAGNFDGASEGYGNIKGEKFKKQYPEEYKNVAEKAAEYAKEHLVGVDYNILSGVLKKDKSDEEVPKSSHCSHIVWQAYKAAGVDIDQTGGMFVTPFNVALSDKLQVVQLYGLNPRKYKNRLAK